MSLAALLAGIWITTPLTALLRKEPPSKGKPRKDGELKQTAIGSHLLAALLAGIWITTPLTALLRKEPPSKGKPRKIGEFKQTSPGVLRRFACRDADNDTPHRLAPQGASPQGEAAKRRRIETDLSRLTLVRHSPQRGKQGTADFFCR